MDFNRRFLKIKGAICRILDLLAHSYEAPSIYQDAQECINFRPEIDPLKQPGQNGVVALYPTPGLTVVAQLFNSAEVRGMRTVSGGNYCVVVCGQYVYVLNSSLNAKLNWNFKF